MQKLSLVDETFDINLTSEYFLSIQVSLDGFSFSILDSIQNKVVYLYSQDTFTSEPDFHLKKVKSVFDETDVLGFPYKKIRIYYSSPEKTTLVPPEIFRPEQLPDFYNITFGIDDRNEIRHSFIQSLDNYAIFGINKLLLSFLKEKYPEIEIQNELVLSGYRLQNEKKAIMIRILRKKMEIIVTSPKISFYNSFSYEGENDMLYYILGVAKNMEEQPEIVILDGLVNKHSEIYHRVRQYFNHVSIMGYNSNVNYSYLIDRLPDARFCNLFNSFSCV